MRNWFNEEHKKYTKFNKIMKKLKIESLTHKFDEIENRTMLTFTKIHFI